MEAASNSNAEMGSVVYSNRTLRALEDAWRIAVCVCNVGSSFSLHAHVAPTSEESHGRVARGPLRDALQRHSHGRE